MDIQILYTTLPDHESAQHIQEALVKSKLVACANVFKVDSCYTWEGDIENNGEWAILFKTLSEKADAASLKIEFFHPYEVPCIGQWTMSVNKSYYKWVKQQVNA